MSPVHPYFQTITITPPHRDSSPLGTVPCTHISRRSPLHHPHRDSSPLGTVPCTHISRRSPLHHPHRDSSPLGTVPCTHISRRSPLHHPTAIPRHWGRILAMTIRQNNCCCEANNMSTIHWCRMSSSSSTVDTIYLLELHPYIDFSGFHSTNPRQKFDSGKKNFPTQTLNY